MYILDSVSVSWWRAVHCNPSQRLFRLQRGAPGPDVTASIRNTLDAIPLSFPVQKLWVRRIVETYTDCRYKVGDYVCRLEPGRPIYFVREECEYVAKQHNCHKLEKLKRTRLRDHGTELFRLSRYGQYDDFGPFVRVRYSCRSSGVWLKRRDWYDSVSKELICRGYWYYDSDHGIGSATVLLAIQYLRDKGWLVTGGIVEGRSVKYPSGR